MSYCGQELDCVEWDSRVALERAKVTYQSHVSATNLAESALLRDSVPHTYIDTERTEAELSIGTLDLLRRSKDTVSVTCKRHIIGKKCSLKGQCQP